MGADELLFGPYLGGNDARLAAAALLRVHPLAHAGETPDSSTREMALLRGVGPLERPRLVESIRAVLDREPDAVSEARIKLAELRDIAATQERFEDAAARQQQIDALDWVTQPQAVAAAVGPDLDISAISGPVRVTFQVRAGSFHDRLVGLTEKPEARLSGHAHWDALAQANADLLASYLQVGAVGEGLGRLTRRSKN